MPDEAGHDLGPCCRCETTQGVRNILMLEHKSPIAGRGWGCLGCHLPQDGAVAVLCDGCMRLHHEGAGSPLFACRGFPGTDGRCPIEALTGLHQHDMRYHPEAMAGDEGT